MELHRTKFLLDQIYKAVHIVLLKQPTSNQNLQSRGTLKIKTQNPCKQTHLQNTHLLASGHQEW